MHSFKSVSFLDMMSAIGGSMTAIANVVHLMSQVSEGVSSNNETLVFTVDYYDKMLQNIEEVERVSGELNLDATLHSISYCKTVLSRCFAGSENQICLKRNNAERLVNALDAIRNNFLAQMSSRLVVVIDSRHASYLNSEVQLFGSEVEDAFPQAVEEISEAGKCLALERPTACVFHLMRAMEIAVEGLCHALGKKVDSKVWGNMLADISNAIKEMPDKKSKDIWSSVCTHLYHVKQTWRNATMHPKTTYTNDEAEAVFQAVKSFMNELAPMVSLSEQP
jgi:hypothetical protein